MVARARASAGTVASVVTSPEPTSSASARSTRSSMAAQRTDSAGAVAARLDGHRPDRVQLVPARRVVVGPRAGDRDAAAGARDRQPVARDDLGDEAAPRRAVVDAVEQPLVRAVDVDVDVAVAVVLDVLGPDR